jgi:hypothetical protein
MKEILLKKNALFIEPSRVWGSEIPIKVPIAISRIAG